LSEAQLDTIPLMIQVAISGHLNSLESDVTFNYDKPMDQLQISTCLYYNVDDNEKEKTSSTGKILFNFIS
jgi:hypothetical protein